ncbi:MAG TPA: cupin domain-containing protein, partial [Alphaproteobacteria bacterium]|nr:cupin domain-containing protein [Alphaproteobacteria bacterium]
MSTSKPRTECSSSMGERLKGRVVKAREGYTAEQGTDYHPGISAETVGSKTLWFGSVILPPGRRTKAHIHPHHESAFYMLSGDEVELWTGDALQYREVAHPGDYLFIPAGVLHVAVNRGMNPAVFIGARNEPTAQESV